MADRFVLLWTIGGEAMSAPHLTQNGALQQAAELMREHGCDLEIVLHLNRIGPPSVLFNKRRMQGWCRAGFPAVQI
jgi:hypothetical protein